MGGYPEVNVALMSHRCWQLRVLIAALATSACSGESTPPPLSAVSVEIQPIAVTFVPGARSATLTAIARDVRGREVVGREVTWTSSDPSLVSVSPIAPGSATATVSPVGLGSATVTATVDGRSGHSAVSVQSGGFLVWPDTSRITISMNRVLRVQRIPPHSTISALPSGLVFTWESSDPAVATVDVGGRVTAVGEGHATISAVVPGWRFSADVFAFRYPSPLEFASVAVGDVHTCGLTTAGAAYCWGHNEHGQLGNDMVMDRCARYTPAGGGGIINRLFRCSEAPVPVSTGLRFASVSAGGRTTCAITEAGAAYCWGDNRGGKTGTGIADAIVRAPAPVVGGIAFKELHVGALDHVCGVSTAGVGYCWGSNANGALGSGSDASSPVPVPIAGGHVWTTVKAGDTACGIRTDGAAYCWGSNGLGQGGFPITVKTCASAFATSCSTTPQPAAGDLRFTDVVVAPLSCGRTTDGAAYCWGELSGTSPGPASHLPKLVADGFRFANIYAGPCGTDAAGAVYCWGKALTVTRSLPDFPVRVLAIAPPSSPLTPGHRCATDHGGILYCWDDRPDNATGFATPFWAIDWAPRFFTSVPAPVAGQQ